MINQNRKTKLSIIERKLNYLVDHPELQQRHPKRFEIVYNRLVERWIKETILLNTY